MPQDYPTQRPRELGQLYHNYRQSLVEDYQGGGRAEIISSIFIIYLDHFRRSPQPQEM